MTPRGGKRDGAGRPEIDDADPPAIPILLRKQDRARAHAAGQPIAVRVRLGLDVLAAVEDGAGIAAVRKIAAGVAASEERP